MEPSSSTEPTSAHLPEQLPPVKPPSASFLMQLFVIPLVIVTIIVVACMLVNWLAHRTTDPRELVQSLQAEHLGSWQKALDVANMLSSTSTESEKLRQSPELATAIADILDKEIKEGGLEDGDVKRRQYLCLALSAFQVPEGIPTLLKAAETNNDFAEVGVRIAAIFALTRRIENGSLDLHAGQTKNALVDALVDAARQQGGNQKKEALVSELRYTAAYSLGVVGGEEALTQLAAMLNDPVAVVRYNAAVGLARQGDPRAVPLLVEMLNPKQTIEKVDGKQLDEMGQANVIRIALSAVMEYWQYEGTAGREPLRQAVQELENADVSTVMKNGYDAELTAAAKAIKPS
ncbi:MAG: HEAT repeat domain-containing protein [Planctomycetales bacterium]|nr:HEAT repeat domain-containing protein [Planctomycetales bacterium]